MTLSYVVPHFETGLWSVRAELGEDSKGATNAPWDRAFHGGTTPQESINYLFKLKISRCLFPGQVFLTVNVDGYPTKREHLLQDRVVLLARSLLLPLLDPVLGSPSDFRTTSAVIGGNCNARQASWV